MTLFFAPCFFQVYILNLIFFKVPDPKKISGRPDNLRKKFRKNKLSKRTPRKPQKPQGTKETPK